MPHSRLQIESTVFTFSPGAQRAVDAARAEAARTHSQPSPAHLFLALLEQEEITPYLVWNGVGVDETRLYAEAAIPEYNDDERAFEQILRSAYHEVMRENTSLSVYESDRHFSLDTHATIHTRHLLLALLRPQTQSNFSSVLESLGLNLSELRLQSLNARRKPLKYAPGHPLNQADTAIEAILDKAEASMRSTFCGRIDTTHLLLGLLDTIDNSAVIALQNGGADIPALRHAVRQAIRQDGELAGNTRRFTPAAQRALDRARDTAESQKLRQWGPTHLLQALMPPDKVAVKDRLRHGGENDDPVAQLLEGIKNEFVPVPPEAAIALAQADFDDLCREMFGAAIAAARARSSSHVMGVDYLHAIAVQCNTPARKAIRDAGGDVEALASHVPPDYRARFKNDADSREQEPILASSATNKAVQEANVLRKRLGQKQTGTDHILFSLVKMAESGQDPDLLGALNHLERLKLLDLLYSGFRSQTQEEQPSPELLQWQPAAASFVLTNLGALLTFFPLTQAAGAIMGSILLLQVLAMLATPIALLLNFPSKGSLLSWVVGFLLTLGFWICLAIVFSTP